MLCALAAVPGQAEEAGQQTAGWAVPHYLEGTHLDLGLAFRQVSVNIDDTHSDKTLATLTSDFRQGLFLQLGSPSRYLSDSRLGYKLLLGWSQFETRTQEIGDEDVDLGTRSEGSFVHVTPTAFWHFGPRRGTHQHGQALKLGVGVGIGYLRSRGDAVFTASDGSRHPFDVESDPLTWSVSVYLDYRYDNWVFQAVGAGPVLVGDPYDYQIIDVSVNFGYSFVL